MNPFFDSQEPGSANSPGQVAPATGQNGGTAAPAPASVPTVATSAQTPPAPAVADPILGMLGAAQNDPNRMAYWSDRFGEVLSENVRQTWANDVINSGVDAAMQGRIVAELMVGRFELTKRVCNSELKTARATILNARRNEGVERTVQQRLDKDAAEERARKQLIDAAKQAVHEVGITQEERRERQRTVNKLIQEDFTASPPIMSLEEMLEDLVLVSTGSVVCSRKNPRFALNVQEAKAHFAGNVTQKIQDGVPVVDRNGLPVMINTFDAWMGSISRGQVMGRTFGPGRGPLCHDPEGVLCVNSWRPTTRRTMVGEQADKYIKVFSEHINYLFGDMAEKFIDYLAFIQQRPEVHPQTGWLHIATSHGLGRNWVASVCSRMFVGYVAPSMSVDMLLKDGFNGQLAGKVLAVIDEIRAGTSDKYATASQMRKTIAESERQIKPKYGREYVEHCVCRWIMFSNHLDALPIDEQDRRLWVYTSKNEPRKKESYAKLYSLLDDADFIATIAYWLSQRDLSKKDPCERPPMNESKFAMITSTESSVTVRAKELCANWPSAYITSNDIATLLSSDGSERDGKQHDITPAMRHAMDNAGASQLLDTTKDTKTYRTFKVRGKAVKVWAIRSGVSLMPSPDYIREQLDKADQEIGYSRAVYSTGAGRFDALRAAFSGQHIENTDGDPPTY